MNDIPETPLVPTIKNAAQVALEIYNILEPLPAEVRTRAIHAALASLGESAPLPATKSLSLNEPHEFSDTSEMPLGAKARKWCQRNNLGAKHLEEIFHFTGETVEIIASAVPGSSKKEMTVNCYLLEGVRGLLKNDEPKISDGEVILLCKRLAAYDKNNHPTFRKSVGNRMTGDKANLFLTGPGENAAADLIKQMAVKP
jgi:hypothetical protein